MTASLFMVSFTTTTGIEISGRISLLPDSNTFAFISLTGLHYEFLLEKHNGGWHWAGGSGASVPQADIDNVGEQIDAYYNHANSDQ